MALYISISYYAMATEIRLLTNQMKDYHNKSLQIEKSKLYHLNAIRIAAEYVPCMSDYVIHIHKSLKNHYQIDILEGDKES